jgi:hypothetical protein
MWPEFEAASNLRQEREALPDTGPGWAPKTRSFPNLDPQLPPSDRLMRPFSCAKLDRNLRLKQGIPASLRRSMPKFRANAFPLGGNSP